MLDEHRGIDKEREFLLLVFRPSGFLKDIVLDYLIAEVQVTGGRTDEIITSISYFYQLLGCLKHSAGLYSLNFVFRRFSPKGFDDASVNQSASERQAFAPYLVAKLPVGIESLAEFPVNHRLWGIALGEVESAHDRDIALDHVMVYLHESPRRKDIVVFDEQKPLELVLNAHFGDEVLRIRHLVFKRDHAAHPLPAFDMGPVSRYRLPVPGCDPFAADKPCHRSADEDAVLPFSFIFVQESVKERFGFSQFCDLGRVDNRFFHSDDWHIKLENPSYALSDMVILSDVFLHQSYRYVGSVYLILHK